MEEQTEHPEIPLQSTTQLPEFTTNPVLHAPHTLAAVQLAQFCACVQSMQVPELKVKPVLHWVQTVGEEQVEHPVIPVQTATQFPDVKVY